MLNFDTTSNTSAKQTRTTQVRHDDRLANLIERAALALAVDKSVFLRAAIEREARRVLDLQSRHTLTPEDAKLFTAALDAPPAPTPRALQAARNYSKAWYESFGFAAFASNPARMCVAVPQVRAVVQANSGDANA